MIELNDWLSIDKTSGEGDATITLTTNSSTSIREKVYGLKIKGVSKSVVLNVKQEAIIKQVSVTTLNTFPYDGGEQELIINSNIPWVIETEGDWFYLDKYNGGIGETTIKVSVGFSSSPLKREGIIKFLCDGERLDKVAVVQQYNPTIEVPTDEVNCFYIEPLNGGEEIEIAFYKNYNSFNYVGKIEYYQNGVWNNLDCFLDDYYHSQTIRISKRTYFRKFKRKNNYQGWRLTFLFKDYVKIGGDLTTLLGPIDNPYASYDGDVNSYAADLFASGYVCDVSDLIIPDNPYPYAYNGTFRGASIETPPIMNLTSVGYSGCASMFYSCGNLKEPPKFSLTSVGENAFYYAFFDCASLTEAPELSATTLAENCYAYMFNSCDSLVNAPELPAEVLYYRCYDSMFKGCTSLSYVKMLGMDAIDKQGNSKLFIECIPDWLDNVSPTGTLIKSSYVGLSKEDFGIGDGWDVIDYIRPFNENNFWIELDKDGEIYGMYSDIIYSTDGNNWDNCTEAIEAKGGIKYYFRNDVYENWQGDSINFSVKGKVGGNLSDISYKGRGYGLFMDNINLYDASQLILPWDTVRYSFSNMFRRCTSLVNAPQLPATTLAEDCYRYMFAECTSLVNGPSILPATTLKESCYEYMFDGCTSLVNAPQLPATTLKERCYNRMFAECTSLVKAPDLPAKSVLYYYCYNKMFYNCNSLRYIKVMAENWNTFYITSWVYNVSPTGTFVKHPNANIPIGVDGIPEGWTVETATS